MNDSVDVDVMILSESKKLFTVNNGGRDVVLKKSSVINVDYNTELDVVMTLPRAVAMENGLLDLDEVKCPKCTTGGGPCYCGINRAMNAG